MQTKQQYLRANQIASTSATGEKVHVYKSGKNKGEKRILRAKEAIEGILPISQKTLWEWARTGKFPAPIKLSSNVTVWRKSDVDAWLENKANAVLEA
ncbi:helix-turn-helix transcriptional regulator [Acinetobacter sp. MD2(2019)]|uniref:helix-turn-helix transcriptional regulator n=1 Tax=Acinetobacter sp. MD2(2019) TaxID=2605273 RepID=UPI002D1F783F|nr:AlpA family phage regulatory protein [Acinetobacter sp. MD2(2019)]MEB3754307.1 AlpA family phage regulatory protein [Acinetobacter sp. MD2(2019)]